MIEGMGGIADNIQRKYGSQFITNPKNNLAYISMGGNHSIKYKHHRMVIVYIIP